MTQSTNPSPDPDAGKYGPGEGSAAEGSEPAAEVTPADIERAMATYSGDGQADDPTGNDALAEVWRDREGAGDRVE
jgi:hypothetical protein